MNGMYITYGTSWKNMDITDKFIHNFIKKDIMHIPLDVVFNNIFGDPIKGYSKHIYIKKEGKESLLLPEYRGSKDLTIDLTTLPEYKPRKINIVAIASRGKLYDQMMQIYWIPFIQYIKQHHENINIYLVFGKDANLTGLEHIKQHIIVSDTPESLIPGVLDKTLYAFDCLMGNDYDYLIRTNMSSFIMIDKLTEYINSLNKTGIYNGFSLVHKKHQYVLGWNICMSKDVVSYVLEHKEQIDRTLIDDYTLGVLLSKVYRTQPISDIRLEESVQCTPEYVEKLLKNDIGSYLFRIKNHSNRNIDIDYLKYLTEKYYKYS